MPTQRIAIPRFTIMAILIKLVSTLSDRVAMPIVGVLCLLIVLSAPVDAYQFLDDPSDYILVHHLDTSQPYWQWQYLKAPCLMFLVGLLGLCLIVLSYRRKSNNILRFSSRLFAILVLGFWIIGFYQWAETGFDH